MSIDMPSIGIIRHIMPSAVISQVIRHIIGGIIIDPPIIPGIMPDITPGIIIGMPIIIGFIMPVIGICMGIICIGIIIPVVMAFAPPFIRVNRNGEPLRPPLLNAQLMSSNILAYPGASSANRSRHIFSSAVLDDPPSLPALRDFAGTGRRPRVSALRGQVTLNDLMVLFL
jgi:hypothetical protein